MSFFKKLSATEGFTLVELMVAVGIMTIAFVGLATMQVTTINGNAIANHVTTGITLAQDKMEELNSLDFNDPELNDNNTANNGNLRDARDDFTVVGTIASADDGHRETGIDGVPLVNGAERFRNDRRDSQGFETIHGMLPGRARTEIFSAQNHITRCRKGWEILPPLQVAERILPHLFDIRDGQVSIMIDHVRIDIIDELPIRPGNDPNSSF